jgi:SAM-dependent methyltransferase
MGKTRFEGSIPAFYDRDLGPFLFEPYADDLALRVIAQPGASVLELACGTGIATRRLRERLPEGAQLVATDVSPAMIARARARLSGYDVHWRTADATALPFRDGVFDAVVCQFGLMFFPDRGRGLSEARRVLRLGGTLIVSVWCSLADNPSGEIVDRVVSLMFEDDPPRFMRVLYGAIDAEALHALAIQAGFTSVTVSRVDLEGRAASARAVATGFSRGSPLSLELAERGADFEAVVDAMTAELERHGGSPFRSPLAALVLTAS